METLIDKHPLLMWIVIWVAIFTIGGFALVLPIVLSTTFKSLWPLMIYLPEFGVIAGFISYMETAN